MKTEKNNSKIEIINIISENIFYTSDLPSDSTYKDLYLKFDKIEKMISLDLNIDNENSCPGLSKIRLSKGELKNKKNRFHKKEVMIEERLLWFFEPEKILNDIDKETMWNRAKYFIEKDSIIFQHDGALLALIYLSTYDDKVREIDKWFEVIKLWNKILENEKMFEKLTSTEKVNINKAKITILNNIIKYSLFDIAVKSIKSNEINTLDHVLFLLDKLNIDKRYGVKEKFYNEIFNRLDEKISDQTKELMHDRAKIKRKDSNSYSDIKFNKSLCQQTYNNYLEIIEPLLTTAFCHLEKKDFKLKLIREQALEVLYSLAVDFTWAKEREISKKILNKASKIYYDTPIKTRFKKLNKDLGEITVFKDEIISYPESIKKYIVHNPYRVLDIPADSNSQEIHRAINRLEIKVKYKFSSNLLWDLKFLPEINIDKTILNFTKKMISDIKESSKARLFWFVKREKALLKISNNETIETASYWFQNSSSLEEKHDSILLALLYLLIEDLEFELIEEWSNLLYLSSSLNFDFSLENKLNRINSKEELKIISEFDHNELILNFLWDLSKNKDDILIIDFYRNILEHYQKSVDYELESKIINNVKVNMFSLLVKQIKNKIQEIDADKFIDDYEANVLPIKKEVKLLNNKYNLSNRDIDNIISEELIHYAINKFPYKSEGALNILYKARKINSDEETINKIDELINSIKPEEAKQNYTNDSNEEDSKADNKKIIDNSKIIIFIIIGFFIVYIIGLYF